VARLKAKRRKAKVTRIKAKRRKAKG